MSTLVDIFIPDLGADKDVDLIEIMVEVGDTVEVEDGLITLETEKASMDVPTTHAGVIKEILVKVGDKVNSGDLIAKIEVEEESEQTETLIIQEEVKNDEKVSTSSSNISLLNEEKNELNSIEDIKDTSVSIEKSDKIYASPSVRKVAREFGVDLGFVKGTGRKGRILKDDIKAYVKEQLSKPAVAAAGTGTGLGFNFPELKEIDFSQFGEIETVELSRIQKISGPSLHRNWVSMPHVTQFDESDITEMESFR
ncbi:dihydrolipoamide acetyltransferase, partial [Arcobacter sp. CECT 8989]|uniref:biotin/lipoyl-containing protein n=1 Tax=Arcobacter sp. CECT 8989 TaxID=2044509 RepID=UPI00100AA91B